MSLPKTGPPPFSVFDRASWSRFWFLFRHSLVSAYKDNCFGIAKGAAYSALLAFFPVLTAVTAVLVQANAESVSRILSNLLFQVVPPGTEELIRNQFVMRGARPGALVAIAVSVAAWAASGVTMSLMEGFRAAYGIPSGRPFVRQRAVAIFLVFSSVLPVLGASALIVFGQRIEAAAFRWSGLLPEGQKVQGFILVVGQVTRYVLALSSIVLVTGLMYHFGPNRPREWRRVWPGAVVATGLWLAATWVFGWYVRNIANYNVLYGSIGAVIALLVWMYVLAIVALIGCEYNAQRERYFG